MILGESDACATTYLYFDEAGNFDFSPNGTSVFVMTCLVVQRPFAFQPALLEVKYDCMEQGLTLEYFHAAEDRQAVRDRVFDVIHSHSGSLEVHTVVVRRSRLEPKLREPHELYRWAFEHLVRTACSERVDPAGSVVGATDHLPIQRNRAAFEKGLKPYLKASLPPGARFELLHHQSRADLNLQVADYISWAIYRKWTRGDVRPYGLIESCIRSEDDPLRDTVPAYY